MYARFNRVNENMSRWVSFNENDCGGSGDGRSLVYVEVDIDKAGMKSILQVLGISQFDQC